MSKSETSICELPPLPKGDIAADTCPVMWVHTDQQLQDYALDAIEADRKRRGDPVYAYRRKGFDRFVTCSEDRYEEMRELDHAFDVRVFYAAPQITEPVKVNAIFETENGEVIGTTDANVKRVEWQDDGSLTVVIDYWPQPAAPKFGEEE